jgi:hypothetical protein
VIGIKVKGIISEEKVTLPEMRSVLLRVESERLAAEKEMSYEFRRSIEHANQLAKTDPEKSRDLVTGLTKMEKMKPEIAPHALLEHGDDKKHGTVEAEASMEICEAGDDGIGLNPADGGGAI